MQHARVCETVASQLEPLRVGHRKRCERRTGIDDRRAIRCAKGPRATSVHCSTFDRKGATEGIAAEHLQEPGAGFGEILWSDSFADIAEVPKHAVALDVKLMG